MENQIAIVISYAKKEIRRQILCKKHNSKGEYRVHVGRTVPVTGRNRKIAPEPQGSFSGLILTLLLLSPAKLI